MFWDRWPSLVVELIAGTLLGGLCSLLVGPPAGLVIGTIGSLAYESDIDPNGWSTTDVWQREVGIIIGTALVALIF